MPMLKFEVFDYACPDCRGRHGMKSCRRCGGAGRILTSEKNAITDRMSGFLMTIDFDDHVRADEGDVHLPGR